MERVGAQERLPREMSDEDIPVFANSLQRRRSFSGRGTSNAKALRWGYAWLVQRPKAS